MPKKNYKYIILIIGLFFIGATNVLADGVGFSSSAKYASVCGFENVPVNLPKFTSGLYTVVKIAVPIILIIMGMIDFIHAIMLNDENNMKKQQKKFINRLLAAIIIFLVMAIVQFVFNTINYDSETKNGFSGCINCILNNNCGALSASENKTVCEKRSLEECTSGTDKNNHTCEQYKSQYSTKEVCITACENYSIDKCANTSGRCKWSGGDSNSGKCIKNSVVRTSGSTVPNKKTTSSDSQKSYNSNQIVSYASKFVNHPYKWGGELLCEDFQTRAGCGVDCSGFVQHVFMNLGYDGNCIGGTTNEQFSKLKAKEYKAASNIQPGDVLFFYSDYHHVGIYLGNNEYIHASTANTGVKISNFNANTPTYWARVSDSCSKN